MKRWLATTQYHQDPARRKNELTSTGSLAKSGEDVHHTGRDTRLLAQGSGIQGRERRLLRCLQHYSITGCQGGANLPRPHHKGEVPGDDLTANTNGLMSGVVEGLRIGVNDLPVNLICPSAIVSDAASCQANVSSGQ